MSKADPSRNEECTGSPAEVCEWIEEMEKRSRRSIRDLVAPAAFQGLSQNEIGCARISMMARSRNAPFKGRIQKRKTNRLQIINPACTKVPLSDITSLI